MKHLIVGYGYCGYYLARYLLRQEETVTTVSRSLSKDYYLSEVEHLQQDASTPISDLAHYDVVYYLIPPQAKGQSDELLQQFLACNELTNKTIVYFGSSGVYGNQQGAWIDEEAACNVHSNRQRRRLSAEQLWCQAGKAHANNIVLLRVAGIYGPDRIPLQAVKQQIPVIEPAEAPWINSIYVDDLVKIAYQLANKVKGMDIFNVADGEPLPMGGLQQLLATLMNDPIAPTQSWQSVYADASELKRDFLVSSKRLSVGKLHRTLGDKHLFTDKKTALTECLIKLN